MRVLVLFALVGRHLMVLIIILAIFVLVLHLSERILVATAHIGLTCAIQIGRSEFLFVVILVLDVGTVVGKVGAVIGIVCGREESTLF